MSFEVGKLIRPCDIVGRPQLSGIACPKTIDLLSQWVSACKERHPQCSETLSGASTDEKTDPVLPTRILKMDNNSVRLVESKGLKGRYVTLSYCWGPPEKMPVVTTRANFSNHLQNVDVSKLPKTYQDAITICRRMSILYLWIDSLCIIQDDRDDWLKESVTMGSIYECADFTIAPSHAPDSWHGFLHLRERQGEPVELSNFLGPEDGPGVKVFARVREEAACDVFPEAGALNYRAWATQEWLLSRRVVFFAPASLMWSCKHITQRETGERCFTISRNTHWKSVVEGFSSRKLTYPMDKMVALEGLRTEWGKRTGYTYMSGVWKETLPDQLIWHVSTQFQGHIHDPLKLPSWSWMHVPSAVRFLPINGAKSICKSIEVSENGKHIIVMGRFKLISVVSEMPEVATGSQNLDGILKDIHGLHGLDFKKAHGMACAIVENGLVIGWVIYDQMESVTDDRKHFALAVMSTVRLKDDQREHLAGHTTDDKLRETWVLIVRKTGKDIYERIGAGKIYGRDPWNRIMMDEVMLC